MSILLDRWYKDSRNELCLPYAINGKLVSVVMQDGSAESRVLSSFKAHYKLDSADITKDNKKYCFA